MNSSSSSQASAQTMRNVLDDGRLIVCVGPGGVGKTTTAAALGLRAAMAGRKTIVLTIDPAKRLANSLGLESLTNDPQQIDLEGAAETEQATRYVEAAENGDGDDGELWAMMLDSEQTFNELIDEYAPDQKALERGRENNIYKLLSSALHGMQEYMALDKLHDLYTGGYFDLVVLDTPPTKNALEFLETPDRAATFFDDRIIKWFLPDRDAGFFSRMFNPGSVVLKLVSKVLGESFVEDLVEFFDTFHYLQEALQQRGEMIEFILRDPNTNFFVITSADPRRMKEAYFFHEKLADLDQNAEMFIINRVIPRFSAQDIAQLEDHELDEMLTEAGVDNPDDARKLRKDLENHYARLSQLANRDRNAISTLSARVGEELIRLVPLLGEDVHNLAQLLKLSDFLTPLRERAEEPASE